MQRIDSRHTSYHESKIGLGPGGFRRVRVGDHKTGQNKKHIHEKAEGTIPGGGNVLVDKLQVKNKHTECSDEPVKI